MLHMIHKSMKILLKIILIMCHLLMTQKDHKGETWWWLRFFLLESNGNEDRGKILLDFAFLT